MEEDRSEWFKYLKENANTSDKSWWVTFWLSLFLGVFGVDRFYTGSFELGLLKFFTIGGSLFWWPIDVVLLFFNKMKDSHGCTIRRPFALSNLSKDKKNP